jgi:hypothetical protein
VNLLQLTATASRYDPQHDVTTAPALEERSTTYSDNVFRVVATTPKLSHAALNHFQTAGSLLPQAASCHYKVCNTGQHMEWMEPQVALRCSPVILSHSAAEAARGAPPVYGTLLFVVPQQRKDVTPVQHANLAQHEPSLADCMHAGARGVSAAADLLVAHEMDVVDRTRKLTTQQSPSLFMQKFKRLNTVKVSRATQRTTVHGFVARPILRDILCVQSELEGALLMTTLLDALNELKRFRKPADIITVVLLVRPPPQCIAALTFIVFK